MDGAPVRTPAIEWRARRSRRRSPRRPSMSARLSVALSLLAAPARRRSSRRPPRRPTPSSRSGRRPSACRPSTRSGPSTSCPRSRRASPQHSREVEAIAASPAPPTFANTVEALDASGRLLEKVSERLLEPHLGRDERRAAGDPARRSRRCWRRTATTSASNAALFAAGQGGLGRPRAALDARPRPEEAARGDLEGLRARRRAASRRSGKERLRAINDELAGLGVEVRRQPAQGDERLPARDRQEGGPRRPARPRRSPAAAEAAKKAGLEGKWVFTLQAPEPLALPAGAPRTASCGGRSSPPTRPAATTATRPTTRRRSPAIAALRAERAQLLGYKT